MRVNRSNIDPTSLHQLSDFVPSKNKKLYSSNSWSIPKITHLKLMFPSDLSGNFMESGSTECQMILFKKKFIQRFYSVAQGSVDLFNNFPFFLSKFVYRHFSCGYGITIICHMSYLLCSQSFLLHFPTRLQWLLRVFFQLNQSGERTSLDWLN